MSTVPLTIRLPQSVYDRLTSEAVDEGDYSPSVLARHILVDWVQHIEFGAPGENDFARFWADARPQAQPDDVASALVKFLLSPQISVKLSSDDDVQALRSELSELQAQFEKASLELQRFQSLYAHECNLNLALEDQLRALGIRRRR